MERQARKIASWGDNVNVKIPVTNTKGESAEPLVRGLSDDGISCNVTAVFDYTKAERMIFALNPKVLGIISVFAGRIADTSVNPEVIMKVISGTAMNRKPDIKILWASPREVLNIWQAERCGCHIITVPLDMLKKYEQLKGKDLTEFSLETCRMFYDDAAKAGYKL